MADELSREDLRDLLGAYALDAVDDDERAQIERILETDPRARAEVESFRETAALLAHAGGDAPSGLWDRIAGAMEEDAPRLRMPGVSAVKPPEDARGLTGERSRRRNGASHRGRSISARVVAVAAAVAVVVIGVLGVEVARQSSRLHRVDRDLASRATRLAAQHAAQTPGARTIALRTGSGHTSARIVYLPDGTGYLFGDSLATLPGGRTYQLWALVGDVKKPTVLSAGILGTQPGVASFRVSDPGVVGFAITDENAPGVSVTRQSPVAQGTVNA